MGVCVEEQVGVWSAEWMGWASSKVVRGHTASRCSALEMGKAEVEMEMAKS